jgi:hypothetical protein
MVAVLKVAIQEPHVTADGVTANAACEGETACHIIIYCYILLLKITSSSDPYEWAALLFCKKNITKK